MATRRATTRLYREKDISNWNDLLGAYTELFDSKEDRWLFRGQRCCEWDLTTTLERAASRFNKRQENLPQIEKELRDEFQRNFHRYSKNLPEDSEAVRWLALMQHHGGPTRLLDWTYSFFVGLFFAIEHVEPNDHSALWAIQYDWYWRKTKRQLPEKILRRIERDPKRGKSPNTQKDVMALNKRLIVATNPWALDERLAVQQGVFLMPLKLDKSFMDNLDGSIHGPDTENNFLKFNLNCHQEFLETCLRWLRRMNISRLSLFPGIDGLAQSLANMIATPHRFIRRGNEDLS
jgi:hypothetical protein